MTEIRVWSVPREPTEVAAVRDDDGCVWRRDGLVWRYGNAACRWRELVYKHGPLTEVVETELETAVRRLREYDLHVTPPAGVPANWAPQAYVDNADDIRTVLVHVLNGGHL